MLSDMSPLMSQTKLISLSSLTKYDAPIIAIAKRAPRIIVTNAHSLKIEFANSTVLGGLPETPHIEWEFTSCNTRRTKIKVPTEVRAEIALINNPPPEFYVL